MALTKLSADSTRIYNEDLVTTAEAIHPGIIENAIDAHPGASIFLGNAGEILTGEIRAENGSGMGTAEAGYGESVRVNAKLGKNGSARRLSGGYSEFSSDGSDTARGTRANWKMYGATVQISGSQRRQNAGQGQVIDQLEYKIKDSSSALVDLVAEDLMTASSQPNSITSLNDVISAGDSLQSVNGASFDNWNARGLSPKGTAGSSITFAPATASFATAGLANWRYAYMNAEEGSIRPNAIVTTDLLYRSYEGHLTPQVRFQNPRIGDLSFESLQFKNASVFHDPYCPSGTTFFINTGCTKIKYLPGAFFNLTPIQEQETQDAFSMKIIFEAQLVTDSRKFNNKITGQTA